MKLKEAISLSTRHFVKTVLFNYLLKDLIKLFMDDEQELDKLIKFSVNILINGNSKFN